MKLSSCLLIVRWPQRVLGISKISAFEFYKALYADLSHNQLLDRLKKQNENLDEIIREYHRQLTCERDLARILRRLNIGCRIIKRTGDANKCIDWADLVVAIGGDGTFLLASKLITNNMTPIFGINPHLETCTAFTLPLKSKSNIVHIFEKLRTGDYTLLMRSRIRTTMTGEGLYQRPFHIHEKSRTQGERRIDALMRSTQRKIADALQPRRRILPWLALNEVFMAEFYASRPIALAVQIDDSEINSTHSSGICVCTGSGSRSWFKTMNMQSSETIQMLVAMATGKHLEKTKSEELLLKYHNNLHFPPEDIKMAYMIYELLHGARCSAKSVPERQMCSKVKIESGGFDAGLVLDGCVSLPFNDGSTATFEIRPEFSLKNIILS